MARAHPASRRRGVPPRMVACRAVKDDQERGFTLVELLVASALGGVVFLILGGLLVSIFTGLTAAAVTLDLIHQGQRAVYGWPPSRGLAEDLRAGSGLNTAALNEFSIHQGDDSVAYRVVNRELVRVVNGGDTAVMAVHCDTMICGYYSIDGAGLTVPAEETDEISLVEVTLTMRDQGRSFPILVTARLRNWVEGGV